jgi:pimeloyl-ACP methyl ester carboxylesterase
MDDASPSFATTAADTRVRHRVLQLDGYEVFYREAGPPDAPVVLLPHGYPCSSYEFRNYMPALADRWRLIAPDFPGCGYSDTPEDFTYDFGGHSEFLERFVDRLGVRRFALYLHDFGTWIGLRLAMRRPELLAALIIQNGDIYEDALGPKYAGLKATLDLPDEARAAKLAEAVRCSEFKAEFLNDVGPEVAATIPPDLWNLHWSLMTPERMRTTVSMLDALKANFEWFPRYQAFLRERRPPTLMLWGPTDGYMPAKSARAYLRDLPEAELHLFEDAGHWLLETHLNEAVTLSRDFLARVHGPSA